MSLFVDFDSLYTGGQLVDACLNKVFREHITYEVQEGVDRTDFLVLFST